MGKSRSVTTAADIYGLGAILYASLANRPPFEGDSPLETLLKVQQEQPERLSRICPAVDSALESICEKCLDKDPDARYRSAGELADDLERWLKGEPISAAPPDLSSLFWRWLSANFRPAMGVVLLGLVMGVLASEMPRIVLAKNLGPYLNIYEGTFPQQAPPRMLSAISAYPVWAAAMTVPLAIILYLCMGWLVDRIVHPKTAAAAILSGMGLGSTAAAAAFLGGFGWMMINQEAIWPGQADLELISATVDGNTTFTHGRTLHDVYPNVWPRYVLKKALADMQSGVPLAIWSALQITACLLFLPATAQVWAAFVLRARRFRHEAVAAPGRVVNPAVAVAGRLGIRVICPSLDQSLILRVSLRRVGACRPRAAIVSGRPPQRVPRRRCPRSSWSGILCNKHFFAGDGGRLQLGTSARRRNSSRVRSVPALALVGTNSGLCHVVGDVCLRRRSPRNVECERESQPDDCFLDR